jgi:MoxR-like ATPase
MIRAARVYAWLQGRDMVVPEDVQAVYYETVAHRVFFNPVYEYRREQLAKALIEQVLKTVAAP